MKKILLALSVFMVTLAPVTVSEDPVKRTFEITKEGLYTPKTLRKGDNIDIHWSWIDESNEEVVIEESDEVLFQLLEWDLL